MNLDLALVLLMLAAAIAMFLVNRPRMDAVALLVMVAMPSTGIITMNEALAGFADPSIILIAALFVIGEGLVMTGVARRLGDWLDAKAGDSDNCLLILLMAAVGGLGSLMSSTAVVAIFIPVVLRISQNRGTAPSRLMMPLSFAALISGMLTLVATAPNLVVNAELIRQGANGFSFFSFTPFGLPLLALGIVYMLFARRLLTSRTGPSAAADRRPRLQQWIERYRLADREKRGRIGPGSPLIGKPLDELPLRSAGVNLLAIERGIGLAARVLRPTAQTELRAGDVLLADVHTSKEGINELWDSLKLEPRPLGEMGNYFVDHSQEIGAAEVILPAESALVGQTVREARIRSEYDLTVIGLRHGSDVAVNDLLDERLKLGDTLLLIGFWSDIRELQFNMDDVVVLNMPAELTEVLPAAQRAPHALAVLGLVVALMISGAVPNVQAALIGCLLMGLLGCVDFDSAYRSINWKSLILIVGMLPFSLALQRTGGVDLAADAVLGVVGGAAPRMVLAVLFVITAALGLFISNTATAVLMAPVALAIAKDLGASPYPFAMTVALAASTAFMTPISSPVNTLVVGPGQYSFGDFVKLGTPFAIIVAVMSVLLVPVFLPF
ncbi:MULTISPECIES: SLC13 family permease [unclassified Bradyrhizobium]|uniref:SLC13 family permease n=1 Tax=unclassified Bradyrhizobium TaxID=2631580 RepID=UPI000401461B|nr:MULTISPECIES: SLC13 family permease [unclassified Bradyrhizobium]QIG94870.1 SLC13 family permease [Bradyrhizobium sp. 6(2017)]